eukprot:scaffold26763_cov116-Isochrysis_galbana.AAC.4
MDHIDAAASDIESGARRERCTMSKRPRRFAGDLPHNHTLRAGGRVSASRSVAQALGRRAGGNSVVVEGGDAADATVQDGYGTGGAGGVSGGMAWRARQAAGKSARRLRFTQVWMAMPKAELSLPPTYLGPGAERSDAVGRRASWTRVSRSRRDRSSGAPPAQGANRPFAAHLVPVAGGGAERDGMAQRRRMTRRPLPGEAKPERPRLDRRPLALICEETHIPAAAQMRSHPTPRRLSGPTHGRQSRHRWRNVAADSPSGRRRSA